MRTREPVGHPVVVHPVVGHPVVGHPVVGHPVVGPRGVGRAHRRGSVIVEVLLAAVILGLMFVMVSSALGNIAERERASRVGAPYAAALRRGLEIVSAQAPTTLRAWTAPQTSVFDSVAVQSVFVPTAPGPLEWEFAPRAPAPRLRMIVWSVSGIAAGAAPADTFFVDVPPSLTLAPGNNDGDLRP